MDYNDKSVCKLMKTYFELVHALDELEDVKKDKNGAVLGWVSDYYLKAEQSMEFLNKNVSDALKEELGLGTLEKNYMILQILI